MAQNTLTVSYKGTNILNENISSAVNKTLLTSGKYCEGDIVITAEGGDRRWHSHYQNPNTEWYIQCK